MTHPLQTRSERSKLHLSVLDAVGDDDGPRAAFAEAIAWSGSGDIADLGTLFSLTDAIEYFVYQAVYHSDCLYAEVDADALREVHGAVTVNLALKLAGYPPRPAGRKMRWTDAPDCEPTVKVTLIPEDFKNG